MFSGYSGVIAPRTDGSRFTNLRFYNFPSSSFVLSIGSKNDDASLSEVIGRSYFVKNIKIVNVSGIIINWIFHRGYIVYD